MEQSKESLRQNLFILHPRLSPTLLKVQTKCELSLQDMLLSAIEPNTTYTLEEFKKCHLVKLQLVMKNCVIKNWAAVGVAALILLIS